MDYSGDRGTEDSSNAVNIFSDKSGKPSLHRMLCALAVLQVLGLWIYATIRRQPMVILPESAAVVLVGALGVHAYSDKDKDKQE